MKNGKCPKCKSKEVYSGENIKLKKGVYGANTIPLGGLFGSHVVLDNYVCANCGYLESYINKKEDLFKIRSQWKAVEAKGLMGLLQQNDQ
jgi:predicted nucleic-acid-binding Zn-ribbon protein